LNNKTIYIIDDEVSVRTTLENAFQLAGFVVYAFYNPFLAIESKLKASSSCILLDLSMPEIGGIEFQQLLHEKD
jgi:two-component system C4-dicarboxylate transport response regulator DctD